MKKPLSKKIDYQIGNNHYFTPRNRIIKTTNINVLLNRIRQEKKSKKKKEIILSISVISILSFISIIVFFIN
jgi:hypothetical protein